MIDLAITNKTLGEVYMFISFKQQAMRIIDGTPNTHSLDVETLRRIYEGIKSGHMVPTQSLYMSVLLNNVETHLNAVKTETENYKETGEFVTMKTENDYETYKQLSASIPELMKWIDTVKGYIKKTDVYLVDLEKMLKTTSSNPSYLTMSQKMKHSTLLTMKGDMTVPLMSLFNFHEDSQSLFMNPNNLTFTKSTVGYFTKLVMKKLLENYLTGYPLRNPYIGKMRSIVIEPEHIIITMDKDTTVIKDLFCPWLFASKDYESVLHFDIGMKAEDKGLELSMNGDPYGFILVDFEKEIQFEKTTVEPYFKLHRNVIWIHECKMMITILLRLGFGAYKNSSNVTYENLLTTISEKFMYIVEEGVVLTYEQVHNFIIKEFQGSGKPLPEQENLEMVCKILEVLASDRGSIYHEVVLTDPIEGTDPSNDDLDELEPQKFIITIKTDFERDMIEILDIVKQYV
jgi:hypothetical protein